MRRSYEQIKISVGYHNLPVIIIGAGGGFTYSTSGPTHHSQEDLALMSLIPGMVVLAPGSPNELKQILPQVIEYGKPTYIRIGKFGEANFDAEEKPLLAKIRKIKKGNEFFFITTGDTISLVLKLFKKLETYNFFPSLLHIHTVKPMDFEGLNKNLKKAKSIIIVEESTSIGGISSSIYEWSINNKLKINIYRMGPQDKIILGNPTRDEIRKTYKYNEEHLLSFCKKLFKLSFN